jgi:hypothetical protein
LVTTASHVISSALICKARGRVTASKQIKWNNVTANRSHICMRLTTPASCSALPTLYASSTTLPLRHCEHATCVADASNVGRCCCFCRASHHHLAAVHHALDPGNKRRFFSGSITGACRRRHGVSTGAWRDAALEPEEVASRFIMRRATHHTASAPRP